MLSVIVPVHNGQPTLEKCLQGIYSSQYQEFECIVVDDVSTDGTAELVKRYPARTVQLEGSPHGPAYARNCGAQAAAGDILFFVDADVVIKPDTLGIIAQAFQEKPGYSALFGSYDECPSGSEFLSQYKNLLHHFVHQKGSEEAVTFWSGCGAIRREVFLKVGGFDAERYPRPSIEDIDLGYRLTAAGYKIMLNKKVQVTHLKQWSLLGLIKTDVRDRALPWTLLILKNRNLPNDLNLHITQRLSTIILLVMLMYMGLFTFRDNNLLLLPLVVGLFLLLTNAWQWNEGPETFRMSRQVEATSYLLIGAIVVLGLIAKVPQLVAPMAFLLPLLVVGHALSIQRTSVKTVLFAAMMLAVAVEFALLLASYPIYLVIPILVLLLAIMVLNSQLYLFFARKRGVVFALAVLPLQLFYYLYSVASFVIGGGIHYFSRGLKTRGS